MILEVHDHQDDIKQSKLENVIHMCTAIYKYRTILGRECYFAGHLFYQVNFN